jgi:NAD(P)-dependent dehydrogenase (short-subunit alcohol dehydrogenase family)
LDGLVYAVGTINQHSLGRLTEADFLTDFRVNAMGAALAIQAALPALKKSDGKASVALYSSVAALQSFTFHASISMAKGVVNGLTLSLAAELAPKIRINAHCTFLDANTARREFPVERKATNRSNHLPLPR